MNQVLRDELFSLADAQYQIFTSRLLPNTNNILGVRLPILRKIAKRIAKNDWIEFLHNAGDEYFEEVMLQGMVIAYIKVDFKERLRYMSMFIPKIDNWSVCDSFCASVKFTNDYKEEMWDFIQPYLKSEKPFAIRFGVVMLLMYYTDKQYVGRAFKHFDEINHDNYYVKMAVAWAISIYYNKLPNETFTYLQSNKLDDFTYNKALQKITESLVPAKEVKDLIRTMKRK
jgi:3-methyladenine DNA glycosylase AlkD